jgi:hypothetical protein
MHLPLRLFSVADVYKMRDSGILPPGARVELLEGILVDKPRPSERELEVIQRLAEALAKHLDASLTPGEPIHPDSYAVFDRSIMVHEWETLPHSEPFPLHRFSIDEYRRLGDVGILRGASHQLVDGVVVSTRPRAPAFVERLITSLRRLAPDVVIRREEPVRLGPYSLVRPAVTLCHRPEDRYRSDPPTGEDVIVAIDLRDPKRVARFVSWPIYARWGIGNAWQIERGKGIVMARAPCGNRFTRVERYRIGERMTLPSALGGAVIAVEELCASRASDRSRPETTPSPGRR